MIAWGITDVGLRRQENQDAFSIERGSGIEALQAVVCDGMGGARGGQEASSLAVRTFMDSLRARIIPGMTPQQLAELSNECIARANAAVYRRSMEDAAFSGMGTTLVSAVTYGGGAVVCNVGDSRAYHISAHGITRVTHDHSVVETLVERGEITPEEARTHPNRNLITRALGPEEQTQCDAYEVLLAPDDYLLLCSDGLVITMTDEEMLELIRGADTPLYALQSMIALSRDRGAPDNVTAVLICNR